MKPTPILVAQHVLWILGYPGGVCPGLRTRLMLWWETRPVEVRSRWPWSTYAIETRLGPEYLRALDLAGKRNGVLLLRAYAGDLG